MFIIKIYIDLYKNKKRLFTKNIKCNGKIQNQNKDVFLYKSSR